MNPDRTRFLLKALFATVFALLVASPVTSAGLSPASARSGPGVTIVASTESAPQGAASTFETIALEYGLTVTRRNANDGPAALEATRAARGVLAVFAHGTSTGATFGAEEIAWADLASAADASHATGVLLIGCYSDAAARALHKPSFGYVGQVDAKLAAFDAFEQLVYRLHGGQVPAKAEAVLWAAIEQAARTDPQFTLRLIEPVDPLSHEEGHDGNHHTKGDEYTYEKEWQGETSAGVQFDMFNIKFRRAYCGEEQIPCGWHADAYVKLDAFEKCRVLWTIYSVGIPAIPDLVGRLAARMGGQSEILALKVCGSIWFGLGDHPFGGGELAGRFGIFIELPPRWFKKFGVQVYISLGVQAVAKSRGDGRNIDVTAGIYLDFVAEVRLWYIRLDYHQNLGRLDYTFPICYACMAENMDSPSAAPQEFLPSKATLTVGPPVARYLRESGGAERLGLPADVDATQVTFDALHPLVQEVFGRHAPQANEDCVGGEAPLDWDSQNQAGNYRVLVCPNNDEEPAQVGGGFGNVFTPNGGFNAGELVWENLQAAGGEKFAEASSVYGSAYQLPSSLALAAEEKAEAYTEKMALEETQPIPVPGCVFRVIPPGSPGGPDFQNGDCWPFDANGQPRYAYPFQGILPVDFAQTGAFNADHHLSDAQVAQLRDAGIAAGGGVFLKGNPDFGSGCTGLFNPAGC